MKEMKRILSLVLCLVMLVGLIPAGVLAVDAAEGETTYVLAGSDFQADSGDAAGAANIKAVTDKMKEAGYVTFDGFLFAGDYSVGATKTSNVNALKDAVQTAYPELKDNMVLIQGNHDNSVSYNGAEVGLVGSVLNNSGANDAEDYGVFVINEKDYNWKGKNETVVKQTAESLETYLNTKRNAGYTKPIFVVSHLPLNYNMRTKNDGDGMYANYIFDVLNEAGNAGLNIIFMFGHDHSNGWDDYLGGAAIYLEKGDKILIAQSSQTVFEEETLAFTYMNAGYVGYYRNVNTGSETDLTMTAFAITDDTVTVERFSQAGLHDLKSAGVTNSYKNESAYAPNTEVYTSPQTITLNKEITPAGEEVEPPAGGNTGSGATERTYTRVTKTSDLVSGGQYLIIYNGSHFMLPEVVEKSDGSVRKGFNIESTSVCGPDTITGDFTAKEWTLTSSGSGWLLGSGGKYAKLTNTSDYKITATLESSGDVFTIGGSVNAFTFSNGTYVLNYNDRGLINGYDGNAATFYIYRMTNAGSTGGNVDTTGGDWITITEPVEGGKHRYVLDTDGVDTGVEYLIVANSYPKALSAASSSNNAVDIEISGSNAYASSDTYGWTFTWYSNGVYYIRLNDSAYLRLKDGALNSSTSDGSSRRWNISSNNDGSYKITSNSSSSYELRWSNSNGIFQASSSSDGPVRLYKYDGVTQTQAGLYGKVSGELTYNVAIGTSKDDAIAAVKAGIDILYHNGDANAAQTFPDDGEGMTWTLDSSYDGSTAGEYPVTIAYNGVTLGVAKVVVPSVNITGYSVEPSEGTVSKGASQAAQTGALIYVQLENGKYYTVPVTVSMLTKADGSAVSTGETGELSNLTLTYNGVKITEHFTLNIVAKAGNNYPEYPNEGAVKVGKTGTGIDFQSSGIAQVEISASGVPMKKGADVIVMLDLSSSMTNTVDGKTRLSVLEASLQSLMTQLKANGDDGQPMDIRIAVADFNRYYTDSSSPYYINSKDHLLNGSIRTNADGTNKVYTGSGKLDAGAFESVHDLAVNEFSDLSTKSGTNYDYAFDAIYQLGEAITTQNAADGVERDLFVIFMSDGAPFQFNYFSAQSGEANKITDARFWNNWLQGTMSDAMFDSNARNDYYNEDGKHWMAEAIKGDPAKTYPVIRKNNSADTDGDNWVNVNGLGAKMYSIGFCLAVDKEITVASMDAVIRNIASDEQYYFRANSATDLNNAFAAIGGDIAYAAYNARFVDQMGDDYNLQMEVSNYSVVDGTTTTNKTIEPKIEIISYDIYTRQDYLNGTITEDKIGDRKGTYTVLETVTFNADGTEAYSDKKTGNIMVGGVIRANTFWYNTNDTAVAVEGVSIPTGTKADGTTTGSTNMLPSETFYWKMGTVQTSELAMRYYVYLEGSMEGTREGGSYPTNEYATLYYDNYLHNPCKKNTVSPVMPWKEANVSYAFYLVNEKGEIIVNQTTGQTGSFANKVAVTNPVVYETVLLNNDEEVSSIDIASLGVLPEGYTLYDYDGTNGATYTVTINSNTTGDWNITSVKDVATTYVTHFDPKDPSAYSNDLTHNTVGDDYTHTTVWFAVLWKVQALPDTVVIDYGLPVDISVLANDMFGENGKLAGVGAYSDSLNLDGHDTTLASGFGTSYTGTYGEAKADASTGKVRYTLDTMEMNGYEKFAYAVNYTGNENAGYYYDTVTVIPATTIYYEDNFLTYTASNTNWEDEGTAVTDAVQAEDRPGKYSLTDANNIYGYDSVNRNMYKYSLGTAKKVHVGPLADGTASYANATFTFSGTGFDIIGMTSNTTGVLAVKVIAAEDIVVNGETVYEKGDKVKNTVVDTYYGCEYGLYEVTYTYDGEKWVRSVGNKTTEEGATERKNPVPEEAEVGDFYINQEYLWAPQPDVDKAMYQVPVLQANDLPYGKYEVTLIATYMEAMDDTTAAGYDLYLDAVRIYDPANDGASDGATDTTIEDAYKADGEGWPSYIELRNQIIAKNGFDVAEPNDNVEGMVFIDGDPSVDNAQISDYISYGPNNEVYLAPGQSVAFLMEMPSNLASVHIGIKSADGKAATYEIKNVAKKEIVSGTTRVEAGSPYNKKTNTISTTTDMYYDLTGWKNDIIVITNTSDDIGGIISLTNIKSTYTSDPNATNPAGEEATEPNSEQQISETADVLMASSEVAAEEQVNRNETYIYMTVEAAELTVCALNGEMEDEVPEETEPEVTEPETEATESETETTEPETEVTEPETEATKPETEVTEPETEATEPETEETEPEPKPDDSNTGKTLIKIIKKLLGWLFG